MPSNNIKRHFLGTVSKWKDQKLKPKWFHLNTIKIILHRGESRWCNSQKVA